MTNNKRQRTRPTRLHQAIRADVLHTAQELVACGLTVGNSGNVSARVPEADRLLLAITPHARYYDTLTPEDIIVVDEAGQPVAGQGLPSSELLLHIALYRARPDVGAVIHSHPVMASVIAVTGRPIPLILEDQVIYLGGQIEVAPYAMTGSAELAQAAVNALGERNACVLAHHGALCVGRDLRAALCACRYLEKAAQVFLLAAWTGPVNVLPPEAVKAARAFSPKGWSGSEKRELVV